MSKLTGAQSIVRALKAQGIDTIFGYPGGQIMPLYDALYEQSGSMRHILVRHEQGAVHAAQGYARALGKAGVVWVTSGPGVTNVLTGLADAMVDSTPLVVLAGQVPKHLLGTDAFQETDVMGVSLPITKWSYQIQHVDEIPQVIARAFYIAQSGRPGPVLIDIPKDIQIAMTSFAEVESCELRTYKPVPTVDEASIDHLVQAIGKSKKPLLVLGQGVVLAHAEQQVQELLAKVPMPVATTLLGLSAIPTHHPLNIGMIGMHGHLMANKLVNECDLFIAVGMRFDDRVTCDRAQFAKQAQIVHIDIDPVEIGKNIPIALSVIGDAHEVLTRVNQMIQSSKKDLWVEPFYQLRQREHQEIVAPALEPQAESAINMLEAVSFLDSLLAGDPIYVTDVGQNQMMAARYCSTHHQRSFITSGGLGTMGFGLPAAIGAKVACPDRPVCLIAGDGGIQMTIQELGTIMQENLDVKIVVLNNQRLGMVRQWQQLFFHEHYFQTTLVNPDFTLLAQAYGIPATRITKREHLAAQLAQALQADGAHFIEIMVEEMDNVFPMVPAGSAISTMMYAPNKWF